MTSDLRMIDLPMPVLRALAHGDVAAAEALIGVPIPAEFAGHTDIWQYMIRLLTERPASAGWTMHALVLDDVIVGNAGFKGAPDQRGEVELGYGIETDQRRKGYAVRAVELLLARAAREPAVSSVLAIINPDNDASIGVITKAGFEPDGERIHERWGRQLRFTYVLRSRGE
jgi:ribosomal-protein-alanine N-acetyltransferase